MLERLAEVEWQRLGHAYGEATDVPGQLQAIASRDPEAAEKAVDALFGNILHQGTVYEATAPAVPFLLELVIDPTVPFREHLLKLLAGIADGNSYLDVHADFLDTLDGEDEEEREAQLREELAWAAAAHSAVGDGSPALVTMLADDSPRIRAAVPYVLACFSERAAELIPLLQRHTDGERDAGAAASAVLAVAILTKDDDAGDAGAWLARQVESAESVDVRAAAAAGLCLTGAPTPGIIRAATEAMAAPRCALDGQLWGDDGRQVLASAFRRHEEGHSALVGASLNAPGAGWRERVGAIAEAETLMQTWRAAPARIVPALVVLAGDRHPAIRCAAVEVVAGAGKATALAADVLADVVQNPPARWSLSQQARDMAALWPHMAGAALIGLSSLGDERCLPLLARELVEPRLRYRPRWALTGMAAHAATLLPAVRAYLRDPRRPPKTFGEDHGIGVLGGLETWGEAAGPALPELIELLRRGEYDAYVMGVLGAIGPAAADATELVRQRLTADYGTTRANAAWALWRITGEAGEAMDNLIGMITENKRHTSSAAPRLEEFGALTAPVASRLEPLLDDARQWIRVTAARAYWAATGDAGPVVPALVPVAAPTPAGILAVECLGRIGAEAAGAGDVIEHIAKSARRVARIVDRAITDDEEYQRIALTALGRIRGQAPVD
jgi:hypothetical protein